METEEGELGERRLPAEQIPLEGQEEAWLGDGEEGEGEAMAPLAAKAREKNI